MVIQTRIREHIYGMKWVLLTAAAILAYQLLSPPIVGLADQGDFRRVIGKFGYTPQQPSTYYSLITSKYVPDPSYRLQDWEQTSSEDVFIAAAVLANKIVSKDGALDIRVLGMVHALAFLAAFGLLLYTTRKCRARLWIWGTTLLVTTDVGYVAYLNSFYAEPATYIYGILLLVEGLTVCTQTIKSPTILRWSLWAALLVLAKPANAPIGLLLGLYSIRLAWRSKLALVGAGIIFAAVGFIVCAAPSPMMDSNTYNMVFLAILPESKTPASDALALGLDAGTERLSGTGAWGPNSGFSELRSRGIIGKRVTAMTVLRFYLQRPARMWRHIRRDLQIAMLLRPELGNFARADGYPPGTTSRAFSFWSDFHQNGLTPIARFIFLLLPVPALVVVGRWFYTGRTRLGEECWVLLTLCCMASFLTASFADGWETIKHMFLFNLLLDSCLICAGAFVWASARKSFEQAATRKAQAHETLRSNERTTELFVRD